MPFFSIYEPVSGPLHYITITLIGLQNGLIVRWTSDSDGWYPHVEKIRKLRAFTGSRLEGYQLVGPEQIDAYALEAMTGHRQSWP